MNTVLTKITYVALVSTGFVASYLLGERRATSLIGVGRSVADSNNAALVDAVHKLQQRMPENFPEEVTKIVKETARFVVADSQLSSLKIVLLASSVISFTVGAVAVWVVPKITLSLLAWMKNRSSETKPGTKPVAEAEQSGIPTTSSISERTTGVTNSGVNDRQRLPPGTERMPRAPEEIEKELQRSAQDVINVVFLVASENLLSSDLGQLRNRIMNQFTSRVNVTILDASNTARLSALAPHLAFRFELVDDRIRELDKKEEESSTLFSLTNDNCVWIFVCHRPTDNSEGASIKSSINSIQEFKSGYVSKQDKHVKRWLKFDYKINSAIKDSKGNMQHNLVNQELIQQEIEEIIADARV